MKKIISIFVMISVVLTLCMVTVVNADVAQPTTFDPNYKGSKVTLSNNNMSVAITSRIDGFVRVTKSKSSGKWYWEITNNVESNDWCIGICNTDSLSSEGGLGFDKNANSSVGYGSSWYYVKGIEYKSSIITAKGDVLGIALDLDNNKMSLYKNGILVPNTTLDISYISKPIFPAIGANYVSSNVNFDVNFGASRFKYAIPEGYQSYNTEVLAAPANLVATVANAQVNLNWDAVDGASKYYVYRSETAGGTYKKIETGSDITGTSYTDKGLYSGTYYYVVTAANDADESPYSNEVSAKINTTEATITVDTLKSEVNLGSEFTADITLHNAVSMCAEDFKVSYNPELFEYVGYEEVTGLKVYKEIKSDTPDTVRFIVASLGKANAINGDKVMVKLKFKAKKAGKDKIDVVKGRIANNDTIEKDILDANCGEKEITVKSALDVNRTGEFTLLDLGIDAWYYGDPVASTDTSKYDTDVVVNNQVDNDDLLAIVADMMNNTNYTPNN